MDQPRWGTKSHRTTKCAQVPPHAQGCSEQAAEHGHGAAPCPSLPWGLQQLPILVPAIPFPLQLPASGASGMMKHYWQVFHTWFLCLLTSGRNHLSASAGYESPDWELQSHWNSTPLGRCCSPHTGQGLETRSQQMKSFFYLSSWEFFPDLLLFLASRGDERIFLDGGPESLP